MNEIREEATRTVAAQLAQGIQPLAAAEQLSNAGWSLLDVIAIMHFATGVSLSESARLLEGSEYFREDLEAMEDLTQQFMEVWEKAAEDEARSNSNSD